MLCRTFSMVIVFAIAHACIHDHIESTKPIRGAQHYSSEVDGRRISGMVSPIRITFDTRFVEQPGIPLENQSYAKSLVSYAQERLRMVLSVQPVVGNLLVPRNCSEVALSGVNAGKCIAASTINRCGEVDQIPQEHLGALSIWSPSGNENNISAGSGIPNSDLIVYVTLYATSS